MPGAPKLHFIENASEGDSLKQLEALGKVFELVSAQEADMLFLGSIFKLDQAISLKAILNKPVIVFCWDYYKWKHQSDPTWIRYADFMKTADLIFVPSSGQKLRLKELLGLDSIVVKSGVPVYDQVSSDEGFILDPVRYYPEENQTWAEEAAKELGIPLIHSEHQYTKEEFERLVATCTFLTCAYREASTGGLSLMEGMYLGKPALVSNSPYMGARDYLGEHGYYFQYDDFEDLKRQMKFLWETRPKIEAREYLKQFTYERMAKEICVAVKNFLKESETTMAPFGFIQTSE